MYGLSREAVRRRVELGGGTVREPGGVKGLQRTPSLKIRQMVFMYERLDMTAADIARYMGYKHGRSVTWHLKRAGVELRSQSENSKRGAQTRYARREKPLERAA